MRFEKVYSERAIVQRHEHGSSIDVVEMHRRRLRDYMGRYIADMIQDRRELSIVFEEQVSRDPLLRETVLELRARVHSNLPLPPYELPEAAPPDWRPDCLVPEDYYAPIPAPGSGAEGK